MFDAYEEEYARKLQDIEFPQYRHIDHLQYFKLIDKKTLVSIRNDNVVKGIGVSKEISLVQFSTILSYKKCDQSDYEQVSSEIYLLLTDLI